jgi:hypothetical protein
MRLQNWIHLDLQVVSKKYFNNGLETKLHYHDGVYYFKNGLGLHFKEEDIIDVTLDEDNTPIVWLN